jgi:NAD dependent epimerase/dehydratase
VEDVKGKKVLVTGAGGFIGSHLAERLVEDGATVRAFVHYNALGTRGWLDESARAQEMEIVAGDVTDIESVTAAVRGCEIVFHLAALIGIPYSYAAPRSYVRTNVEGTLNVLEACRRDGVARVLCTSTSEVYGTARTVPIDEQHPLKGQSPYSASKIGADKIAESYYASFSLPVVIVRPFNTFGPRQSPRAVIPTIIEQLLVGDEVMLGSVHPTRDLNFVSDTVDGFQRAATAPAAIGETVQLGSGTEISVGDLVTELGAIIGRTPRVRTDDARLRPPGSEVERLIANPRRAHDLLGWQPIVSLRDGLVRTVEWFRARPRSGNATQFQV